MVDQEGIIVAAVAEYLVSAQEAERKGRRKTATTLYFKVIAEISDFLLYRQILKVPTNHTERYDLLRRFFPDIYRRTSPLFRIYRKTYSQIVDQQDLEKVKNEALKLVKETGMGEHLPGPPQEEERR